MIKLVNTPKGNSDAWYLQSVIHAQETTASLFFKMLFLRGRAYSNITKHISIIV